MEEEAANACAPAALVLDAARVLDAFARQAVTQLFVEHVRGRNRARKPLGDRRGAERAVERDDGAPGGPRLKRGANPRSGPL